MSKKAVFIIAQNRFQDQELLDTKKVLDGHGVETKIAAKTRDAALGKLGTTINPDLSLAEVDISKIDALIFIGGPGAFVYFDDQEVLGLAREAYKKNKILGAICVASSILANAGILIGKTVTGFPTEEQNLKNRGADYTGMQTEVDGKIVTAIDPSAANEFGQKLVYLLGE